MTFIFKENYLALLLKMFCWIQIWK